MASNVIPMPGLWRRPMRWFGDSFRSFVSGIGTDRDKSSSLTWFMRPLGQSELEYAYRSDWIARKVIEIPAFDITRSWREWEGSDDQIKKLKDAERKLFLQQRIMDAMVKARLYGGSALLMGTDEAPLNEEMIVENIKADSLKFVHVIDRWSITAGPIVRDITSPWYGEPSYYMRSNVVVEQPPGNVTPIESSGLGYSPGDTIFIHPSRIIRFVGCEYPSVDQAMDGWGDSILLPVAEAIKTAGNVNSSIGAAINEMKFDIIKVKGLTEMMDGGDAERKLQNRFANANVSKSVINSILIDMDSEDWDRKELHLNGMDNVMQMYLYICAGAADIPVTRFLGREPAGQNATGESDFRNYYDRLKAEQEVKLTPKLSRLDEVLIRHALGSRPEEVKYEWNSLWQESEIEKSNINLRRAQAHKIDVDSGLINPDALRQGRINSLIEDPFLYPGLQAAIDEFGDEPDEVDENEVMAQAQMIGKKASMFMPPQPPLPGPGAKSPPPPPPPRDSEPDK